MRKKKNSENKTYYAKGEHNVLCDYSGFKVKSGDVRRTWDGFVVATRFWEPRQPQDFVRGQVDKISTPAETTRSEGNDVFLTTNEVSTEDL